MRIVFYCPDFYCPAEIKEIKEILLPARCAALSAISALSAGHYYLMRKVFCPAVIGFAASLVEEIKEILLPLGEALSAISALSAGHYYLMRIVFISHSHRLCRFARRRNKGNKGNHVTLTLRSSVCYFCHFCGTLLSHAHSILLKRYLKFMVNDMVIRVYSPHTQT